MELKISIDPEKIIFYDMNILKVIIETNRSHEIHCEIIHHMIENKMIWL